VERSPFSLAGFHRPERLVDACHDEEKAMEKRKKEEGKKIRVSCVEVCAMTCPNCKERCMRECVMAKKSGAKNCTQFASGCCDDCKDDCMTICDLGAKS
jgi:hypothetical protein